MNRLKELRKANRMTQSDVAKIVGIGQSGYSFWESGRSKIDDAGLRKLAALYNVSVDYLLGTDTNQVKASVKIPVLGDVAAGIPIEAVENIVDYEEIDAALASTGEFFGLRIKGDSMEPADPARGMWSLSASSLLLIPAILPSSLSMVTAPRSSA